MLLSYLEMPTFKAKRSCKSINLSFHNPLVKHHVKKDKINRILHTPHDVRNYYRLHLYDFRNGIYRDISICLTSERWCCRHLVSEVRTKFVSSYGGCRRLNFKTQARSNCLIQFFQLSKVSGIVSS